MVSRMKERRYLPVIVLVLAVSGVLFIRETPIFNLDTVRYISKPSERRDSTNREKSQKETSNGKSTSTIEQIKVFMPVIVTVVVLLLSLIVILSSRYSDTDRKWAFGAIGTIVGYWLGR
jgi:hypothetical protein